jgi:3-oxoacyl-[acyl-carrier-protein] synthase II
MTSSDRRRVVITGMAVISPFGLTPEELWDGLAAGASAVGPLTGFPTVGLPLTQAAEARAFTGHISEFGDLDGERKKAIRKGLKLMCRETQMAVAAAQRALAASGLTTTGAAAVVAPERIGCVFGSDYMLTLPDDFTSAVAACRNDSGQFEFDRWATDGLPAMEPLWLLKYLPNMPASHIAIFNDLRGPSNSLTVREASGHLAVGEATITIGRGAADVMLVGATGTRIHPMKMVHALQNEQVAMGNDDPTGWSRPFDRDRRGMVLGEAAAVLMLEELEHARQRSAPIYGEVLGHGAAASSEAAAVGRRRGAVAAAVAKTLAAAGCEPADIGHIHAQGLSTRVGDQEEAAGLGDVLGRHLGELPLVAAKASFGNLGAASGLVECVASLQAVGRGGLFPLRNYETPDESCPVRAAVAGDSAGECFLSLAVTPQGQAGALLLGRSPDAA